MTNERGGIAGHRAVIVKPLRKTVDCALAVPGSKSLANRALLLAGVAEGHSLLEHIPDSDDIRAALSALRSLGLDVRADARGLAVSGRGLDFPVRRGDIDIGSSGTVGRFLPGLLAAAPEGEWRLVSSQQLARRPLRPLLDALGHWQAAVRGEETGRSFPLLVTGRGLAGGETGISAKASSQFASGLLLAAPLCRATAVVAIRDLDPDEAYIDMTLELMRRFGVIAESAKSGTTQIVRVPAPQKYRAAAIDIEADFNSALYFLCLPLLAGGTARVTNLSGDSRQPGRKFLEVLRRLGARIGSDRDGVTAAADGGILRGGFEIDMRPMSEMALTLGVLAVFADKPVTMTNLAHIRGHETDRLAVLAQLLRAVGVTTEEGESWLRVMPKPRRELRAAVIDSHDDHRLAMSFSLLALGGNGLTITNPGAVAKTFPTFFECLAACGAEVETIINS